MQLDLKGVDNSSAKKSGGRGKGGRSSSQASEKKGGRGRGSGSATKRKR